LPPSIDVAPARDLVQRPPDERTDQPDVDPQANAPAKPDVRPIVAEHPSVRARHKRSRTSPSIRIARARSPHELQGLAAECCWLEPMDRRAPSRPASRNRVARRDSWSRDSWTGWHFPDAD
jgi:hypothetical protein